MGDDTKIITLTAKNEQSSASPFFSTKFVIPVKNKA